MRTTGVQAVIFDFDYTLADSSKGAVECINFALEGMGLPLASQDAACRTIGLSLNETFLTLAGHHKDRRGEEFSSLFLQRAGEVMTNLTVLYESVPATIEVLRESGLRLGIVSTKFRCRIEEILERDNLRHYFQVVIGGDDVEEHKPHPEGLLKALDTLQCAPASIVYVGDSVTDAELAKRAAVPFIGVLSGVTPREHFASYDAIEIVENLSELPRLITESFSIPK